MCVWQLYPWNWIPTLIIRTFAKVPFDCSSKFVPCYLMMTTQHQSAAIEKAFLHVWHIFKCTGQLIMLLCHRHGKTLGWFFLIHDNGSLAFWCSVFKSWKKCMFCLFFLCVTVKTYNSSVQAITVFNMNPKATVFHPLSTLKEVSLAYIWAYVQARS